MAPTLEQVIDMSHEFQTQTRPTQDDKEKDPRLDALSEKSTYQRDLVCLPNYLTYLTVCSPSTGIVLSHSLWWWELVRCMYVLHCHWIPT